MKRYSGPVPKSGPRPPAKRRPLPRVSHKRLSEREQRAEVRRLRTVLVGLPIDDWQPEDWETFTVEVNAARTALEVTP